MLHSNKFHVASVVYCLTGSEPTGCVVRQEGGEQGHWGVDGRWCCGRGARHQLVISAPECCPRGELERRGLGATGGHRNGGEVRS
jgi:hypothetical protein